MLRREQIWYRRSCCRLIACRVVVACGCIDRLFLWCERRLNAILVVGQVSLVATTVTKNLASQRLLEVAGMERP